MFILSEKNIGIPLSEINKITVTYFSSKSEILNIYDINFNFDENIIPLITSILEVQPKIHNFKIYNCIDTITTIREHSKSIIQPYNIYPSFYYDIDKINNNKPLNIFTQDIKLINTVIDDNDNQLIRMYKDTYEYESKSVSENLAIPVFNDFLRTILSDKEYKKIYWEFEFGNFEIIIDLTQKNTTLEKDKHQIKYTAQYKININIIEDNKIIASRLIKINDMLQKINKIKSAFIIN